MEDDAAAAATEEDAAAISAASKAAEALPFTARGFCTTTSLHGWCFLATSSPGMRLGWVLIVLASLAVATFFLFHSASDFASSTVQTTQDTSR